MSDTRCECIGWNPDGVHYLRTGDTSRFFGCTHCRDNYDGAPDGNHGRCNAKATVDMGDAWLCEDCAKAERIPEAVADERTEPRS